MGTWELVERPPGRKLIDSKWCYKVKRHADGSIEKFKARLVARGFTQVEGVDYEQTSAPVARLSSVRIVLALSVLLSLERGQSDIANAYLNAKLRHNIYMKQPKGKDLPNLATLVRQKIACWGFN